LENSAPPQPQKSRQDPAATGASARRKASLTTRAIALAVVLLILIISYASSLRVYLNQRQELAATRAEIAATQDNIERLGDEIARWNDPAYVKTQARIRLGWVLPGETGYRIVDDNGKPITGETEIAADEASDPDPEPAWYQKLWGSVETADDPAPADPSPKQDDEPVTEDTEPSADPTR
jgi:cell division protein FtsB